MKTKSTFKAHQGDVQLQAVTKLPSGAKPIANKPIAYGEHSGHIHILTGDLEMFEDGETLYAKVGKQGARLQHTHETLVKPETLKSTQEIGIADHKSILLSQGCYEFYIQNAYNPFSKVFEKVID